MYSQHIKSDTTDLQTHNETNPAKTQEILQAFGPEGSSTIPNDPNAKDCLNKTIMRTILLFRRKKLTNQKRTKQIQNKTQTKEQALR